MLERTCRYCGNGIPCTVSCLPLVICDELDRYQEPDKTCPDWVEGRDNLKPHMRMVRGER